MRAENQIDYVEISSTDLEKTQEFFSAMFGWSFESWGDEYISFNDGRIDGGFYFAEEVAPAGGVLVVFHSADLERDMQRAQELGATVSKAIFSFPGGRRFHFRDPVGNEFAIWSEHQTTDNTSPDDGEQ